MTERQLKHRVIRLRDVLCKLHDDYEYTQSGNLREHVDLDVVQSLGSIKNEIDTLMLHLIT